ncbi:unnamed protein product [Schistosoma curassoni]|uniref:Uncharacterized protein n=1 Tax=Schistosoma curassoni TaxID=6186 RepID=A0A183KTS3_9TREM|nr:unnamed protein product [Schistosoma curassoni]
MNGSLSKIQIRRNKKTPVKNSRTRARKAKTPTEYTEENKKVKRNIRADKQKYVEGLEVTVETAAREGNMKRPNNATKKLSRKYCKPEQKVQNQQRKSVT